MPKLLASLAVKHPSVGAVPSIGLFGAVELIRNRADARANGAFQRHVARDDRARRVLPAGRTLDVGPMERLLQESPLSIAEEELVAGVAIIDRALAIADESVV